MQGLSLLFFALVSIIFVQGKDEGGCCFYSDFEYKNEIGCSNAPFRLAEQPNGKSGIKSFRCTKSFAALIIGSDGQVMEEASCGDEVFETTEAIMANNVTVAECLERRCCFYTGKNKDGIEFCMFQDTSLPEDLKEVQANGELAVAECLQDWKATLYQGEKTTEVDCGTTVDLPSGKFDRVVLRKCPKPKATAEMEVEQELMVEESADLAFSDQSVDVFQGDQVFPDQVSEYQTDQAYSDYQFDQAVGSEFEMYYDPVDDFDSSFASDAFDQTFQDLVITDNNEYYADFATDVQGNSFSSGSSLFGSLIAISAVFVVLL